MFCLDIFFMVKFYYFAYFYPAVKEYHKVKMQSNEKISPGWSGVQIVSME
jgi:hypothetical protein